LPYLIQGESPPLPREPVVVQGVTYVPVRDLTETLGGCFEWDEDEDDSCATIAKWSATLSVGSSRASVNGMAVDLSAPVICQDGSLWAPADFLYYVFGYDVEVDGHNVSITNPNGSHGSNNGKQRA